MSAVAVAQVMLEGFDRHYGLFRYNAQQQRIRNGILDDVFPYPEELRFRNRHELQS
jgi:isocitrate dehydrogenase kinase/phosphatase